MSLHAKSGRIYAYFINTHDMGLFYTFRGTSRSITFFCIIFGSWIIVKMGLNCTIWPRENDKMERGGSSFNSLHIRTECMNNIWLYYYHLSRKLGVLIVTFKQLIHYRTITKNIYPDRHWIILYNGRTNRHLFHVVINILELKHHVFSPPRLCGCTQGDYSLYYSMCRPSPYSLTDWCRRSACYI